jgi:putative ABC transport system permease protein
MTIMESVSGGVQSLRAHKLRSLLMLLGMVMGIASVIVVVSLIDGINDFVSRKIFNLGADVFIVSKTPNVILNTSQFVESLKRKNLDLEDYRAVLGGCQSCKMVGASYADTRGHVKYAQQSSAGTTVRGWTPSMLPISDVELDAGRSITEIDNYTSARVAVIGHDVFDKLMPATDPIGKALHVDGELFTVIGLARKQGAFLGQNRDNWVMMPIHTWENKYSTRGKSLQIWAKAYGVGAALDTAADETRAILRARRHDGPDKPDSFELDTYETFLKLWSNLSRTIFGATIAIVAVALFIAGVTIMNVMLVSVTERASEIGIRKAVGARKRDIMRQFLTETTILSLGGGLLGILSGILISKFLNFLIGMPSVVKLWSILAALFVSATVGLVAGVYPALRASRLEPIAALRFEN